MRVPTAAATGTAAAPTRSRLRRLNWVLRSTSLMFPPVVVSSAEAAGPLQNLDAVPVRILDEEEARDQRAIVVQRLDVPGRGARVHHALTLGVEIVDDDGQVAMAVAELVRLGPAMVDGEFDLERARRVAHVDQGEAVERDAVDHLEPHGPAVELDRAG